jgi:hypothetical protein
MTTAREIFLSQTSPKGAGKPSGFSGKHFVDDSMLITVKRIFCGNISTTGVVGIFTMDKYFNNWCCWNIHYG